MQRLVGILALTVLCATVVHCYYPPPSRLQLAIGLMSRCIPLLIQQNIDGSKFFNRNWQDFKFGFGNSRGDYWLGNELLHQLTIQGRYKLRFDLQQSKTGKWFWAEYSTFIVLSEKSNYKLHIAGFSGNAKYDAFKYHNGMMFSTYDRDNDLKANGNCPKEMGGGFWHKHCATCEVNSPIGGVVHKSEGFTWDGLPGGRNLQSSRMWLMCR